MTDTNPSQPESARPAAKLTPMTAEQFLAQAHEPKLAEMIDATIDTAQQDGPYKSKRDLLREAVLLLRTIAVSMPQDEDEGLDARRAHLGAMCVFPSWRECIGALLQLEFSFEQQQQSPQDGDAPQDDGQ